MIQGDGAKLIPTQELEEQNMPVIVCPHCKRGSDFEIRGVGDSLNDKREAMGTERYAVAFCKLCERPVWMTLRRANNDLISFYPQSVADAPEGVEGRIRDAYIEAQQCLANGAPNGSLCMCRRAIDEAADFLIAKSFDKVSIP